MVAKAAMKQPKVMVLEASEEWDRRRERRVEPRAEPVKVKLDGMKKTTLVRAKLMGTEKERMVELLRENKFEFT